MIFHAVAELQDFLLHPLKEKTWSQALYFIVLPGRTKEATDHSKAVAGGGTSGWAHALWEKVEAVGGGSCCSGCGYRCCSRDHREEMLPEIFFPCSKYTQKSESCGLGNLRAQSFHPASFFHWAVSAIRKCWMLKQARTDKCLPRSCCRAWKLFVLIFHMVFHWMHAGIIFRPNLWFNMWFSGKVILS